MTIPSAIAEVDRAAVLPLPQSRKIYIQGSRPDIRVPMREISQSDTTNAHRHLPNPPIHVYDTSGPYTDPEAAICIHSGLPALRTAWIDERQDTDVLDGPSSAYGRGRLSDPALA